MIPGGRRQQFANALLDLELNCKDMDIREFQREYLSDEKYSQAALAIIDILQNDPFTSRTKLARLVGMRYDNLNNLMKRHPRWKYFIDRLKSIQAHTKIVDVEEFAFEIAGGKVYETQFSRGVPVVQWVNKQGKVVPNPQGDDAVPAFTIFNPTTGEQDEVYRRHELKREVVQKRVTDTGLIKAVLAAHNSKYVDQSKITKNVNVEKRTVSLEHKRLEIVEGQKMALENPDYVKWTRQQIAKEQGQQVAEIRHWSHDIVGPKKEVKND